MSRRKHDEDGPYYGPSPKKPFHSRIPTDEADLLSLSSTEAVTNSDLTCLESCRRGIPWTDTQRRGLCILRKWFSNKDKDIAKIHNTAFQQQLNTHSSHSQNQNRMTRTTSALNWQYADMQKLENPIIREVSGLSFKDVETKHRSLLEKLKNAAKTEGILLEPSPGNDTEAVSSFLQQEVCSFESTVSQSISLHGRTTEITDEIGAPRTSSLSGRLSSTIQNEEHDGLGVTGVDKLNQEELKFTKITDNTGVPIYDSLPMLLFRAYSNESQGQNLGGGGFRAARYREPSSIENEVPSVSAIIDYARTHLDFRSEVQTPLISTTSSLNWATKKALEKLSSNEREVRIAVIDSRICDAKTKLYYAAGLRAVLYKKNVQAIRRYGARLEYLAWNEIPAEAVLADFAVEDFQILSRSSSKARQLLQLDRLERGLMPRSLSEISPSLEKFSKDWSSQSILSDSSSIIGQMLGIVFPALHHLHAPARSLIRVILHGFLRVKDLDLYMDNPNFVQNIEKAALTRVPPTPPETPIKMKKHYEQTACEASTTPRGGDNTIYSSICDIWDYVYANGDDQQSCHQNRFGLGHGQDVNSEWDYIDDWEITEDEKTE